MGEMRFFGIEEDVMTLGYDDKWKMFIMLFNHLGEEFLKQTHTRGFTPEKEDPSRLLMMQASEIFEAFDAFRCNDPESEKCPGFKHLEEELADALLRIMIDSAAKDWKVAEAAQVKDKYNQTRSYMHGGKKF